MGLDYSRLTHAEPAATYTGPKPEEPDTSEHNKKVEIVATLRGVVDSDAFFSWYDDKSKTPSDINNDQMLKFILKIFQDDEDNSFRSEDPTVGDIVGWFLTNWCVFGQGIDKLEVQLSKPLKFNPNTTVVTSRNIAEAEIYAPGTK